MVDFQIFNTKFDLEAWFACASSDLKPFTRNRWYRIWIERKFKNMKIVVTLAILNNHRNFDDVMVKILREVTGDGDLTNNVDLNAKTTMTDAWRPWCWGQRCLCWQYWRAHQPDSADVSLAELLLWMPLLMPVHWYRFFAVGGWGNEPQVAKGTFISVQLGLHLLKFFLSPWKFFSLQRRHIFSDIW